MTSNGKSVEPTRALSCAHEKLKLYCLSFGLTFLIVNRDYISRCERESAFRTEFRDELASNANIWRLFAIQRDKYSPRLEEYSQSKSASNFVSKVPTYNFGPWCPIIAAITSMPATKAAFLIETAKVANSINDHEYGLFPLIKELAEWSCVTKKIKNAPELLAILFGPRPILEPGITSSLERVFRAARIPITRRWPYRIGADGLTIDIANGFFQMIDDIFSDENVSDSDGSNKNGTVIENLVRERYFIEESVVESVVQHARYANKYLVPSARGGGARDHFHSDVAVPERLFARAFDVDACALFWFRRSGASLKRFTRPWLRKGAKAQAVFRSKRSARRPENSIEELAIERGACVRESVGGGGSLAFSSVEDANANRGGYTLEAHAEGSLSSIGVVATIGIDKSAGYSDSGAVARTLRRIAEKILKRLVEIEVAGLLRKFRASDKNDPERAPAEIIDSMLLSLNRVSCADAVTLWASRPRSPRNLDGISHISNSNIESVGAERERTRDVEDFPDCVGRQLRILYPGSASFSFIERSVVFKQARRGPRSVSLIAQIYERDSEKLHYVIEFIFSGPSRVGVWLEIATPLLNIVGFLLKERAIFLNDEYRLRRSIRHTVQPMLNHLSKVQNDTNEAIQAAKKHFDEAEFQRLHVLKGEADHGIDEIKRLLSALAPDDIGEFARSGQPLGPTDPIVSGVAVSLQREGKKRCHLIEELERAVRAYIDELSKAGRTIDWRVESGDDVFTHAGALSIMLDAIVDNAVKYGLPGAPIEIEITDKRHRRALEISNTGSKVSARERPLLLNRGYRGAAVVDSDIPGAGLGLYHVREIAKLCGAKFRYKVEKLKGNERASTHTIRLEFPVSDGGADYG